MRASAAAWRRRYHRRRPHRKRWPRLRVQVGISAGLGIGIALGSYLLLYLTSTPAQGRFAPSWGLALKTVYPSILFCGGIVAGLLARLVADRDWAWLKAVLATPALYIMLVFALDDAMQGGSSGILWPAFACTLLATWPFTYLAIRLLRRPRLRDPNAPPRCCNCGYELTGNVTAICPECGSPVSRPSQIAPRG